VQLEADLMMIGLPICRDGDKMFIPGSDDQIVDGIAALAARLGPLTKGHQPTNGARLHIEGFVTVAKLESEDPSVFIYKECEPRELPVEHLGEQPATLNRRIGAELRVLATEVRKVDADTEERFVLSLVLEPNDGEDGPFHPDTQNDIYSATEIRRAAHGWMEKGGAVDLQHNWKALGVERVKVVENYLAPVDMVVGEAKVLKGSWLLGLRVLDDELWAAAKDGKLGAFSIGGSARRVEVEAPRNG
jgi:hypothetical protein